jgi:ribosomal protein L1
MKTVLFPIKIIARQSHAFYTGNVLLSKGVLPLRVHGQNIDALVQEIKEHSCEQIEETLSKYHENIGKFAFVCHGEVHSPQLL